MSDSEPPTLRVGSGAYLAFRDDALEAARALTSMKAQLDTRKTAVASALVEQLETFADEFGTYEPDAVARGKRVLRFYLLQEQVANYLAGER